MDNNNNNFNNNNNNNIATTRTTTTMTPTAVIVNSPLSHSPTSTTTTSTVGGGHHNHGNNQRNYSYHPQHHPTTAIPGNAHLRNGISGGNPNATLRYQRTYMDGFSTSLCGLFVNPYDHSSCCALICCGTCLHDRNQYVFTGEYPTPWWIRCIVYICGYILFSILGIVLSSITESSIFLNLNLFFIIGMFIRATHIRMKLRKQIMKRIATSQAAINSLDQDDDDFCSSHRRVHRMCGCNDKDVVITRIVEDNTNNSINNNNGNRVVPGALDGGMDATTTTMFVGRDFCWHLWELLAMACCGYCGCWCNCNGMCATGQEDRELRRIFPSEKFHIDYITMQPYAEYYPAIEHIRKTRTTNLSAHMGAALSTLSAKLLWIVFIIVGLLLLASIFQLMPNFSFAKVLIMIATLFQAIFVLYIVYWKNHRFDLSLDAVIKTFVSGFVLAIPFTMVIEVIMTIIAVIILVITEVVEDINDATSSFSSSSSSSPYSDDIYYGGDGSGGYGDGTGDTGNNNSHTDNMKTMFGRHPALTIIYYFFQTFIIASLTEELAKFFCFWIVEHPDYIDPIPRHSTNDDVVMMEQSSIMMMTETENYNNDVHTDGVHSPTLSSSSIPSSSPQQVGTGTSVGTTTNNNTVFQPREDPGLLSIAASIRIGLISTAAGFACCENIMYIFGGAGQTLSSEILVLIMRSLLPVHPICAAIQSIGVIKRDVEHDTKYQIGRVLLPAVLLHGIFDFIVMMMALMEAPSIPTTDDSYNDGGGSGGGDDIFGGGSSSPYDNNNNDPYASEDEEQPPPDPFETFTAKDFFVPLIIASAGLFYYYIENKKQYERLYHLGTVLQQQQQSSSSSGNDGGGLGNHDLVLS